MSTSATGRCASPEPMLFIMEAWTAGMTGTPLDARRDDRSLDAPIARHERSVAAVADVARRVRDEGRLDGTFADHADHADEPQSPGGTIVRVAWHNAQHRDAARHMLERLGAPDLAEGDPQERAHETRRH